MPASQVAPAKRKAAADEVGFQKPIAFFGGKLLCQKKSFSHSARLVRPSASLPSRQRAQRPRGTMRANFFFAFR